jgi:tetratricopeptide (TPR) repeat protein
MSRMTRDRLRIVVVLAGLALAAPARAQLGIDLSAPKSAPKKDEKKPAKPSTPQAIELRPAEPGKASAGKERMDAAKRLFDEKAYETAALAFDQILREPALAPVHEEARYQLAKSLVRMGLNHAALLELDELIARGPSSKYYATALEWIFAVGRKLRNEQPVLQRVARASGQGIPPDYQDRFHYLLAKYEFERGRALQDAGRATEARTSYEEARRLAGMVREQAGATPAPAPGAKGAKGTAADVASAGAADEGDLFAKARFVDGLALYAEGDAVRAVESFKEVVRLTNPKRGRRADPELRELAFLQLARIHYEARQNRYAIFYYDRMPWGGESWLEGLWEASYAHYRIGDYEKALGNLLTLQSPYFRDQYFPESYILKSIIYYENCRYPEARQILEDYAGVYEPVYDEIVALTSRGGSPAQLYDAVIEGGEKAPATRTGVITRKILNLALTDQNVKRLSDSIGEIEQEMDVGIGRRRPEFRQSALGKDLVDRLAAEKRTLVDEAGARTRAKLEYERDGLRALLAQALRIKIEVSRNEREALEGSLASGQQVEVLRDLKFSAAVSDEHLYWPYEGEFWRDELGTYSYTLTKGCRVPKRAAAR